jgi:RNA polymerase sigma factor (TIGR02999 family)
MNQTLALTKVVRYNSTGGLRTVTEVASDYAGGPEAEARCLATGSAQEWFAVLYNELRRLARGELFRHQALTLGPTTLLHEAWLRLGASKVEFAGQDDLIRYAARVMRGIVIDHIRQRASLKRGGEFNIIPYRTFDDLRALGVDETIRISDALEELTAVDPRLAELVELKFFAGLSFSEIAVLRDISERTVQRDWNKARTLLYSAIRP